MLLKVKKGGDDQELTASPNSSCKFSRLPPIREIISHVVDCLV